MKHLLIILIGKRVKHNLIKPVARADLPQEFHKAVKLANFIKIVGIAAEYQFDVMLLAFPEEFRVRIIGVEINLSSHIVFRQKLSQRRI